MAISPPTWPGTTARTAALDANTNVTFVANGASNFAPSTLDGSYTINSLNFNTGGVTIANGTGTNTLTLATSATGISVATGAGATPNVISANLVLGGTQNFAVTDLNSTLNISGAISDGGNAFSLTKTGLGTLVLSGTNTYAGSTTVSSGTLIAGAAVPMGAAGAAGNAASPIVLGNSSTSIGNFSAAFLTGGAFNVGRPITIANQATTGIYSLGGNTNNTSTFSGRITASQGFSVTQAATTGGHALNLTGGIDGAATSGTVTANFANAGAVKREHHCHHGRHGRRQARRRTIRRGHHDLLGSEYLHGRHDRDRRHPGAHGRGDAWRRERRIGGERRHARSRRHIQV